MDAALDVTMSFRPPGVNPEGRLCLVVVEGETSAIVPLPDDGVLLIGRGPEADLSLQDQTVSRKHARILVAKGEARVQDLESHNGTKVNGETIDGARRLVSGDVIGVCQAVLVFHDGGRAQTARALLDAAGVRARLEEELERGLRYGRPAALVAVALDGRPDRGRLARALEGKLRLLDVVGLAEPTLLYLLCPEADGAEARELARIAVEALAPLASPERPVRAGVAAFPSDGASAETLIAAARAAVHAARPGAIVAAPETARTLAVGEREVLVAEPAMLRIFGLLERLAQSELPVLILGETGVGKENAAYAVHAWSARAKKPFVTLNCAALQETLVESELFGYEKGAFTGATQAKPGVLETAAGGTVFLDEVGELSPAVQAKLLRVLEQKRVQRLGDVREREIDLRLVAATNRNLEQAVKEGRFRQDLYFRLSAAQVVLPPLRERQREIGLLARAFLAQASEKAGRPPLTLAAATEARLQTWTWPGNVRELRNAIAYAAATCDEDEVQPWHLPDKLAGLESPESPEPGLEPVDAAKTCPGARSFQPIADELRKLERQRMREALEASGGVQRRAAELIAMPLRTFVLKYKQYGLKSN